MKMHIVEVVVPFCMIFLCSLCDGFRRYHDLYEMNRLVEGSKCNGDGHICTKMPQCPAASKEYNETGKSHSFPRCGFVGNVEVVCCPPHIPLRLVDKGPEPTVAVLSAVSVNISETGKRKCVRACEEITTYTERQINTNIIDGDDALSGEFPHMAALGTPDDNNNTLLNWTCGGSLISDRYVLTAGHCVITRNTMGPSTVRIGRVNITDPNEGDAQEFIIKNSIVHPQYNRKLSINDIALLELNNPIQRSVNLHPACLYTNNDDPNNLVATGWGVTSLSNFEGSKILQKANLVAVPISECNATIIRKRILDNLSNQHFCAIAPENRTSDTCLGDSGGPLQRENIRDSKVYSIVGITSIGNGCGGNTPGIYTRVSSYLDWIEGIVWVDL